MDLTLIVTIGVAGLNAEPIALLSGGPSGSSAQVKIIVSASHSAGGNSVGRIPRRLRRSEMAIRMIITVIL